MMALSISSRAEGWQASRPSALSSYAASGRQRVPTMWIGTLRLKSVIKTNSCESFGVSTFLQRSGA